MITSIAKQIAIWLIKQKVISKESKEEYTAAAEYFLIIVIPIILSVIFSLLFGKLIQGICFIMTYSLLRKFAGGFHLKNQNLCLLFSTIILAIFIRALTFYTLLDPKSFLIIGLVSSALIIVVSPVDAEPRKLSSREKRVFKITASILASMFFLLIFLLNEFHTDFSASVTMGLLLTASLQAAALITQICHSCRKIVISCQRH